MKVLVTGWSGFLGQHVIKALIEADHAVTWTASKLDLRRRDDVALALVNTRPDAVVHLAAVVGGIEDNRQNPAKFFYDNIMMNTLVMDEARNYRVQKFISLSSACAYPRLCSMPMKEEMLWEGFPEPTNSSYGLSKRLLVHQTKAYREQYGLNAVCLVLANLYGPGDHFNDARSHVIPALISRMAEAKQRRDPQFTVWGSGTPTRDFLYVEDAADAIVCALNSYNRPEPINIGSGQETSIAAVAAAVKDALGYQGRIVFDRSKPDGQPRRVLDTTKAREILGWEAKTNFKDGIRQTVDSFLAKVK